MLPDDPVCANIRLNSFSKYLKQYFSAVVDSLLLLLHCRLRFQIWSLFCDVILIVHSSLAIISPLE